MSQRLLIQFESNDAKTNRLVKLLKHVIAVCEPSLKWQAPQFHEGRTTLTWDGGPLVPVSLESPNRSDAMSVDTVSLGSALEKMSVDADGKVDSGSMEGSLSEEFNETGGVKMDDGIALSDHSTRKLSASSSGRVSRAGSKASCINLNVYISTGSRDQDAATDRQMMDPECQVSTPPNSPSSLEVEKSDDSGHVDDKVLSEELGCDARLGRLTQKMADLSLKTDGPDYADEFDDVSAEPRFTSTDNRYSTTHRLEGKAVQMADNRVTHDVATRDLAKRGVSTRDVSTRNVATRDVAPCQSETHYLITLNPNRALPKEEKNTKVVELFVTEKKALSSSRPEDINFAAKQNRGKKNSEGTPSQM